MYFPRRLVPCLACGILGFASLERPCTGADPFFVPDSQGVGIVGAHLPADALFLADIRTVGFMGGGAVGDFNNDGWQDVFVLAGGRNADYLFINDGDGTFTNRAAAWGVAVAHMGFGAAVADFDNDGWLDVFATSLGKDTVAVGQHRLYRNEGGNHFTDVAAAAGVQFSSAEIPDGLGCAFGDIELDGDLDLFVTGWAPASHGNRLFLNNGDATFTDVTEEAGIDAGQVWGFSPCFVDMDHDRYPELLLVGDFGSSQYYRNNGDGSFTEATASSGTGLDGNGMGHAVADFDRNGLNDWYVTSVHSLNSGSRDVPGTGNMLYMNQGNHEFVESSQQTGTNDGGWGWGAVSIDADHDGWTDIIETNGWHVPNGDGEYEWRFDRCYAYRNLGNGTFEENAAQIGLGHHDLMGRALLNLDLENDGDQDLVIISFSEEIRVYRNELSGSDANWLRVFLDTSSTPGLAPNGVGTRLEVRIGDGTQIVHLSAGCNYNGHGELSAHFGLGPAVSIDLLRVEWTNGMVSTFVDVSTNQTITLSSPPAPAFIRGDCNVDGDYNLVDPVVGLDFLFLGAGHPPCRQACDGNGDGGLTLADPIYLLTNLFANGAPPPTPHPSCGSDAYSTNPIYCMTFPPCL